LKFTKITQDLPLPPFHLPLHPLHHHIPKLGDHILDHEGKTQISIKEVGSLALQLPYKFLLKSYLSTAKV